MNTVADIFCVIAPIFFVFSKIWPILLMLKAIITANSTTGKLVPKAKSGGSNNPSVDLKTNGTRAPKYKTPL